MRAVLQIYLDCASDTAKALRRSPWTLLWPMALIFVYLPASTLLAPLGIIGGLLLALVYDALLASFLFVVSELVRRSPVRIREMGQSMKPYFWPIMNVLFVLWVAQFLLTPILGAQANADAFLIALGAVLFILLNAVPEVIYLRGTYGGIAAISESVGFVQRHWIEWLMPNVAFGALLYFGLRWLEALPFGLVLGALAGGAVVHVAMVFRGFLFQAIDGTTRRQRELRARLGR